MLGLLVPTNPTWAKIAKADVGAVLVDHAHCEMKAASNAMSLVARYGGLTDTLSTGLVLRLTDLAQEELEHFRQVLQKIEQRGEVLGPPPVDDYASELRKRTQRLAWTNRPRERIVGVADRLIVGALIEARSAERFKLLADALDGDELGAFYTELFASEARHYSTFVDMAVEVVHDEGIVRERLQQLAQVEADVVQELGRSGVRATIHG
jgi:tRNA 2-(methylsulfanyl)-N6-isopentenyladenosine37 hydroxylase